MRLVLFIALWLSLLLWTGSASAQSRLITVELGVAGEMTPGAWNPLRVSLRDQPPLDFILQIDQGSLREGPRLVRYSARLTGGSGIRVFEDDVFLPAWRSMSWQLRDGAVVLVSGSFERGPLDLGPLQLVVAESLGARRALLEPELRAVDVLPSELPERLAAYDGVATVIIDPSAAAPRPEAVVAAAAAGATVVLLEPLSASHRALARLAPEPAQRLGVGWLVRAPEAEAARYLRELDRLDTGALTGSLISAELRQGPTVVPLLTVLLLVAGYSTAVLLFVRYGGMAGYLASLALALIVGLTAYGSLRPEQEEALRSRQLVLGGGPLAWRQPVQVYFSLADGSRRFEGPARALEASEWQADQAGLELAVARWRSVAVAQRPSLQEAGLRWREGRLENLTSAPLTDVYVLGLGPQSDLGSGDALEPRREGNGASGEVAMMGESYAALAALLPEGSALARRGAAVHVALPPPGPRLVTTQETARETAWGTVRETP